MDRRTMPAGAMAALATPLTARAQQAGKTARIGVLLFGVPEPFREGFRQALGARIPPSLLVRADDVIE